MLARLRVLLNAAPTYLALAAVIASVVFDEISKVVPDGWQDNTVRIGGAVASVLAAATAIVRRVTPVLPHQRGLLNPPSKEG